MPDYGKAKAAVISMFELLERVPSINNWESSVGDKLNEKEFKSNVSIKDVEFTYPSRPDAKILKTLRLDIKHGERVAFVGSSGCGKSTVTQLIERFYDPSSGTITLDGKDIKELNLHWLRAQLGIVSQEPVLFDLSIEENIAYGDSSRVVTSEEIEAAAKQANIHDFISNLPNVGHYCYSGVAHHFCLGCVIVLQHKITKNRDTKQMWEPKALNSRVDKSNELRLVTNEFSFRRLQINSRHKILHV